MAQGKPFIKDLKLNYIIKNSDLILQLLAFLLLFFTASSAYLILNAPNDYLQGIYAKIMYIHVPTAWCSMMLYVALAIFSILYFIVRNPIFFYSAKALAPLGLMVTIVTLITGAIWGKPTWGTWWVWDARLTSMLILGFIYIGYIAISTSFKDEQKGAAISSIFAIVGLLNIPIIKFSVNIWSTLHQPSSILKMGGPSIHISMVTPLLSSFCLVIIFCCMVFILRLKSSVIIAKFAKLQ